MSGLSKKEQAEVNLSGFDEASIMKTFNKFATKNKIKRKVSNVVRNNNNSRSNSPEHEEDETVTTDEAKTEIAKEEESTPPKISKLQYYNRNIKKLDSGYKKFQNFI